jgi:N-sulfoglucosamine sulfohydrolase
MGAQDDRTKPDIIFINCHDLGRRLSVYGQSLAATPALERLAREGITFDNFYSTSSLCTPARGSILTGRHPHQVGLFGLTNLGWDLNKDEVGIPEYLNKAGYDTILFGGQHETRNVNRLGYKTIVPSPGFPPPVQLTAPQVADYIKSLPNRESRPPVYINYFIFEPHRHDYWDKYTPVGEDKVVQPGYLPDTPDVKTDLARYDGLVEAMDKGVEAVLNSLDEAGMAESTLVLFTTDHGIPFPRAKCTIYDSGTGVSAMARWPRKIKRGKRDSALLSHVDWAPTILELTGENVPGNIAGKSFLPRLLGQNCLEREEVFCEATYAPDYDPIRCIRTKEFKLIMNFDSNPAKMYPPEEFPNNAILGCDDYPERVWEPRKLLELYDLSKDPDELHNLADKPDYEVVREDLRGRLLAWMERTEDPIWTIYRNYKLDSPANMPFASLLK